MDGHVHLKVSIRYLVCVGFWPLKFKNTFVNRLYKAYFNFTRLFHVVFVLSQFMEMYVLRTEDLDKISFLMSIMLLYALGLLKMWVLDGARIKRLILKIKLTERHILNDDEEYVRKEYRLQVKKTYAVNIFLLVIGNICSSMFCATPVFTELIEPPTILYDIINNNTIVYRPRPLPLASWFPFDRYKYYKTAYAWHLIASFIIPTYLIACDNLFVALITFAGGQIKILQRDIDRSIRIHKGRPDEVNEAIIRKELQKCIEYHRAIITYVTELSKAMRIFLMLDFAACGLQMGVIGFQAAVTEISFSLLRTVIYLVTMLVQLHLFYWYGNEILIESEKVAMAIWKSDWYMCNTKTKKDLLIIMTRSQRSLTLSVGPFYKVSTATMMLVLRTGYSYAAIIRRLYSD